MEGKRFEEEWRGDLQCAAGLGVDLPLVPLPLTRAVADQVIYRRV